MAKFPPLPLKEVVEAVEKLFAKIQRTEVDRITASRALGYSGENGAARTKLGALNSYGLIHRGKKIVKVTELGVSIAQPLGDSSRQNSLKEAALKPPLFKDIWENYRQCSESVLTSTLIHTGLDPRSASNAAKIFKRNAAFASLGNSAYSPQETPPSSQEQNGYASGEKDKPQMTTNVRYVIIPVDIGDAAIPVGMSEADFDLLLETLQLWKKKIVRFEEVSPHILREPIEE